MKKLLLILAMALCVAAAQAQGIKGEKTFGLKGGYITHNTSALAGLEFTYAISNHFRLAPEVGCIFRHKNEDGLDVGLNCQFPFAFDANNNVSLYPLAGLAFQSWGTHMVSPQDQVDVTTHANRFGANLGAGFDFRCSPTLRVTIEARYVLVKSYSSLVATAGISYVF